MLELIGIVIIAACVVVCAYFTSNAHIKLTIAHTYPQTEMVVPDTKRDTLTPVDLEKIYKENDATTFDDVLKVVQDFIGGDLDANSTTTR